jgi:hypothetical protein
MKKQFTPMVAIVLMALLALPQLGFSQLPTDSLSLWLRGDSGVVTTGASVTQWNDISGNSRNAVLSQGNPTLVANGLSGQSVVHFDGVDGCLKTPAFQTFDSKRGTIFVVARLDGPGSGGAGYGTIISTYVGNTYDWQFGAYPGNYGFYDGNGGGNFVVSSAPPAVWGNLTLLRKYDDSLSFYKNGALVVNSPIDNNQPAVNEVKIGSHGAAYETLNGDIAEIIIYNRALTPTELTQVNNYLATKYVLPPTANNQSSCTPASFTLTASGGTQFHWYANDTTSVILATGASYTTPLLNTTTTYYVASYNGTTESQRIPVIANIGAAFISIAPLASHDITVPFTPAFGPFTNNTYSNTNEAKYAFDGDTTNYGWGASSGQANDYLGFVYHSPVVLTSYGIYLSCAQDGGWCSSGYSPKDWTFQGSNGASWVTLDSVSNAALVIGLRADFNFANTTAYKSYRINITATQSGNYPHITEFFLVGADSVSDQSYITASDVYNGTNLPEYAFDNDTTNYGWGNEGNGLPSWLAYDFKAGNAQVVNGYSIYNSCDQNGGWCDDSYSPTSWSFQGTNDDSTWTTLDTIASGNIVIGARSVFPISNTAAFQKYRLFFTNSLDGSYVRITEVELLQNLPLCHDSSFTATIINAGDTPVLQWKVNGANAGSGNAVQTLSGLHNGDVISCVLTATNACQTGATVTSNSSVYHANTVSTITATVCRDSLVIHGVPVSVSGTYDSTTVTATGCDSLVHYVLTVDNTCVNGINDVNSLAFNIYPNPANDFLFISVSEQMASTEVYDMIGKQVVLVNGSVSKLNIANLTSGVYTIQVKTATGKNLTRKFIKE